MSSIFGSAAARSVSASIEISTPGKMIPPRYSPVALTGSNVIAVPKSTQMQAPPTRSNDATALTSRSGPISRGLS